MSDDKLSGERPKLKGLDKLNEALARTAKKKPREKLTQVQQFELIAKAISREGPQGLPEFPVKLHVVEHVRGEPVIYEEMEGQVLQRRSVEFVGQQVLRYCSHIVPNHKFEFTAAKARNAADFWYLRAHRLETEILPVAQASEIGFTFHRLPWDFIPGECPIWDEMFNRMENAEAGMAWLGGLFIAQSDRQQYWWIHGDGGNGKGALNRFLHKIFNGAYKSETAPTKNDKFWTSGLLNARIISFGDCNNYNFPSSGLFKSITGADPIKVEPKGEPSFSAKLVCKLLFLSNERPNIGGGASDIRRAIFSEIAPITGEVIPTEEYDAMLWAEGSAFLYNCIVKYRDLCPRNGPVPVDTTIIDELVEDNEDGLDAILHNLFYLEGPEPPGMDPKLVRDKWFVTPRRLHQILDKEKFDDNKKRHFISFLRRKYLISKGWVRLGKGDEREKRYVGIREKPNDF